MGMKIGQKRMAIFFLSTGLEDSEVGRFIFIILYFQRQVEDTPDRGAIMQLLQPSC